MKKKKIHIFFLLLRGLAAEFFLSNLSFLLFHNVDNILLRIYTQWSHRAHHAIERREIEFSTPTSRSNPYLVVSVNARALHRVTLHRDAGPEAGAHPQLQTTLITMSNHHDDNGDFQNWQPTAAHHADMQNAHEDFAHDHHHEHLPPGGLVEVCLCCL